MSAPSRLARIGLRTVALGYLAALLLIPLILVFYRTFEDGFAAPWEAITSPEGINAFKMTVICVGIAVPLNTIFGVAGALVLVRQRFRGRLFIDSLISLPFAISPVVIGLALVLVYGKQGWFGPALENAGIQVIFSLPGMVLATIFVSLPFVVREVQPVLVEIGEEQEEAASTLGANGWQTFWKVTLPAIRWGVTYGVVLATARALGEFGAVAVVSGKISGQTETLPLFVENEYNNFNVAGAYAASIVLALIAVTVLIATSILRNRGVSGAPPDPTLNPAGQVEKEA
jgi:sulfate transport system permease protein